MPATDRHRRTDLDRPLVVWDGDCHFCRGSIVLLRRWVGDAIDDAPYQCVHDDFPTLERRTFSESVSLLEPDGEAYRGAEAVFRALARSNRRILRLGRWLYDHIGWFARLSEWVYDWIARHRPQLSRLFRPLLPR